MYVYVLPHRILCLLYNKKRKEIFPPKCPSTYYYVCPFFFILPFGFGVYLRVDFFMLYAMRSLSSKIVFFGSVRVFLRVWQPFDQTQKKIYGNKKRNIQISKLKSLFCAILGMVVMPFSMWWMTFWQWTDLMSHKIEDLVRLRNNIKKMKRFLRLIVKSYCKM